MDAKTESFSNGFQDGYSNYFYDKPDNVNYMKGWNEGKRVKDKLPLYCPAVMRDPSGNLIVWFPYVLSGIDTE